MTPAPRLDSAAELAGSATGANRPFGCGCCTPTRSGLRARFRAAHRASAGRAGGRADSMPSCRRAGHRARWSGALRAAPQGVRPGDVHGGAGRSKGRLQPLRHQRGSRDSGRTLEMMVAQYWRPVSNIVDCMPRHVGLHAVTRVVSNQETDHGRAYQVSRGPGRP